MINDVQKGLSQFQLDGWLLYDFKRLNPLALQFLKIPENFHLTRRFFYWIPVNGEPIKLVSSVENPLENNPGKTVIFSSFQDLKEKLKGLVAGKKIAMEYSPMGAVPEVSRVDAGTIELIKSFGAEVVSSGDIYQAVTCVLNESQIQSHLKAADFLDKIVAKTWNYIFSNLGKITELDAVQFIKREFSSAGLITDSDPMVSVNEHTAIPHYVSDQTIIKSGDWIMIDLWAKFDKGIYADITRVGVASPHPSEEQLKIFEIVKEARDNAVAFVREKHLKAPIYGFEVDQIARSVIDRAGYGPYFIHRLGHNIHESTHGPGANNDNLETEERRQLLAGTLCSIEPGIYQKGKFGVRLEFDLYLDPKGLPRITGGEQTEIVTHG